MLSPLQLAALERDGYLLLPEFLKPDEVEALIRRVSGLEQPGVRQRRGQTYAVRNLLRVCPEIRELVRSPGVMGCVEAVLGPGAFPVRGILFDKLPGANWPVLWHQDRTLAVRGRPDQPAPGFDAWTEKEGVLHVQPPAAVLERMLTVRLHLDPCGPENGPLNVVPGSHLQGKLSMEAVRRWVEGRPKVACTLPAGGTLLMRPLLLHSSSPSQHPDHRRVVHLDFAAEALPCGLEWDERGEI